MLGQYIFIPLRESGLDPSVSLHLDSEFLEELEHVFLIPGYQEPSTCAMNILMTEPLGGTLCSQVPEPMLNNTRKGV